jgi:hypothetical protein
MKRLLGIVALALITAGCLGGGSSHGTRTPSARAISQRVAAMPIPPFNVAHLADVSCVVNGGGTSARCSGHAVANGNRAERPTIVVFQIKPNGALIPTYKPSAVFCAS